MAADPAQKTDRLSPALDLVPEAVVAWNDDGKITAWNAAATRLFGYTRTEAVNRSVTVLVPPDRSEEQTQIEASLLADSTPQELNSVRRNRSGKRIPVHIHYPLAALVGRPFRTLVPNAQLADAQRHGSGAAAEQGVPGRRVDGTMFAVGVSINPAVLDGAAYVAVVRDETERRAAERIKNEFLSVISHELRTPLTSIRGSLGLLEAGVLGALPDEAQEIVGIARSNTERLVQLINDILDLEKLDAGPVELRLEDISVLDVVASAARDLEIVAAQAGARLVCAEIAADLRVRGDRDCLVQVLINLVSNAIKYSPTGGTVELRVAAVADAVRVTVTDEGPGVPEAERGKLFRNFAQGDSSDTRQKSGTGLGLAISKAIVEQHGGRIGLDPTGPGGACFWFELPNPIAACSVSSFEAILPDAQYDVLLVEQQRLLAQAMRIVLKSGGHRVRRVADLDRARYAVALTTPGLVLFDPCTEEGAGDFLNAVACAGSPPARVVPDHP